MLHPISGDRGLSAIAVTTGFDTFAICAVFGFVAAILLGLF